MDACNAVNENVNIQITFFFSLLFHVADFSHFKLVITASRIFDFAIENDISNMNLY